MVSQEDAALVSRPNYHREESQLLCFTRGELKRVFRGCLEEVSVGCLDVSAGRADLPLFLSLSYYKFRTHFDV